MTENKDSSRFLPEKPLFSLVLGGRSEGDNDGEPCVKTARKQENTPRDAGCSDMWLCIANVSCVLGTDC